MAPLLSSLSLLRLAACLALSLGGIGLAALWSERSRPRPRLATGAALASLVAPLLLPDPWIFPRFLFAVLGVLSLARTYELLRRPHTLGFSGRVWFQVALFDLRRSARVAPHLDAAQTRWLIAHLGVGLGALWLLRGDASAPLLPRDWALRWAAGLAFCYALVECTQSLLLVLYSGLGVELPPINDRPILSRTLAEFWGRRWNRVVGAWLRDYCFMPLARRGHPRQALAAAFGASALLHFWIAWVPLGLDGGLSMACFFPIQGGALLLERRLKVSAWPPLKQRGWTVACIVGPSPFFVEPMLRIFAAVITP